ncbi:MAG: hypothetical protein IPF99_12840 [Deltaproteobacteria bacterium]|nr:hypothetical protein [Deltaproteobacteria bacterium]
MERPREVLRDTRSSATPSPVRQGMFCEVQRSPRIQSGTDTGLVPRITTA